jgi:ABC-2 type transport system ATP-binding protein
MVGLDPVQALEMRALIRGLTGRTILLSTHVLSEASVLCSRVVILARGRLIAEDTAAGLAARLERQARLAVRVEGPPGDVAAALAALPGVTAVEPCGPGGEAAAAFEVIAPDARPVQRALARAVVERGWTLLEVRVSTPTLEDLFVRAVTDGHGGA